MATTKKNTKATAPKKSMEDTTMETKEVVTNEEKKNEVLGIQEITIMYAEVGIQCKNPNAKGNYRIMKGGSSLNVKPKKGYQIYSTDDDFANISSSGLKKEDLVIEEGTNAQDHVRPHTIICNTVETLRELLALYAMNPLNKVVVVEEEK